MPIHIIPTRISTTGKTLNSIIPINPTSAAYQMIKLTAAAKVPSAIAQTMRIYHSDAYAKERTEVRNSADENVKIYNIKHSHQPI